MNTKQAIERIQRRVDWRLEELNSLAYNIHHYYLDDVDFQKEGRRNYDKDLERYLALSIVLDLAKKQVEELEE